MKNKKEFVGQPAEVTFVCMSCKVCGISLMLSHQHLEEYMKTHKDFSLFPKTHTCEPRGK
jgi:hypothetical protein